MDSGYCESVWIQVTNHFCGHQHVHAVPFGQRCPDVTYIEGDVSEIEKCLPEELLKVRAYMIAKSYQSC